MVKLILCVIAAEAMTQLACKAGIFDKLREWLKGLSAFTNDLLSCPYCVSVWVAAFTLVLYIGYDITWWFILLLVLHRASNVLHDAISILVNCKINQILKR